MKLDEFKNKVCALLGIDTPQNETAFCAVLDSAAKKTAVYTKSIKKSAQLSFTKENRVSCAELPTDFASFCYVRKGNFTYTREIFEIIAGKIRSVVLSAGEYELIYYAFPPDIDEVTDDGTEIFADGYICDIAAYGAAMELCADIYPGDVQRYMRLATEYDERLANALAYLGDGAKITNGFFTGARGVFN